VKKLPQQTSTDLIVLLNVWCQTTQPHGPIGSIDSPHYDHHVCLVQRIDDC